MIDWNAMSDAEIAGAIRELERREQARKSCHSPGPWTAHTFQVRDANGREVCHCGGVGASYDGPTPNPERGVANARAVACGPDGIDLAKLVISCTGEEGTARRQAAITLLAKAGVTA